MDLQIGIDQTGINALLLKTTALDTRVQSAIFRKAARAGGAVLLKATRAKAPVRTGTLKKSLALKVKKYRKVTMALVGPSNEYHGPEVSPGVAKIPRLYAWAVEFGHIGARAHPFMRPALDESRGQILEAVRNKLAEAIELEARKLRVG